jgi:glutathione S-transferase
MSLTLFCHPLSSFCWKALIALYETEAPFEAHILDLGDAAARAAFLKLSPMGKMPVLRDAARNEVVPESSIIIDYLAQYYPGPSRLLPADPDAARRTRLADRFYDAYVHEPMQKIVGDILRPEGGKDPVGVGQARARLQSAYDVIEAEMAAQTWAAGEAFTLADCAAAPALHYANRVEPFGAARTHTAAYLARLEARPSFARTLQEAEPYRAMFPG